LNEGTKLYRIRIHNYKLVEINIIYCLWSDVHSSYMRSYYLEFLAAHHTENTSPNTLDCCLFVSLTLQPILVVFFHSPVAGFSLLVFEVTSSHTTTRHSR